MNRKFTFLCINTDLSTRPYNINIMNHTIEICRKKIINILSGERHVAIFIPFNVQLFGSEILVFDDINLKPPIL